MKCYKRRHQNCIPFLFLLTKTTKKIFSFLFFSLLQHYIESTHSHIYVHQPSSQFNSSLPIIVVACLRRCHYYYQVIVILSIFYISSFVVVVFIVFCLYSLHWEKIVSNLWRFFFSWIAITLKHKMQVNYQKCKSSTKKCM